MFKQLNNDNFILYAAHYYDNPGCADVSEFYDDLKRFKYLKRLFNQYMKTDDIKERHVLNHLIILKNVFGVEPFLRMLVFRLNEFIPQLKPFLIVLNILPVKIITNNGFVWSSDVPSDLKIESKLRSLL